MRSKKWPKNSNDIWLERGRIKDTSEIKHFYELDKEYILASIVRTNNEPVINKYLQYILSLIDFTLPDIYIEYYLLYDENYVYDRYDDLYFLEGCQPLITKIMERL